MALDSWIINGSGLPARVRDGLLGTKDSARFPGDPGEGNYYVGWCDGPKAEGQLSQGKTYTEVPTGGPISVYHTYSAVTNRRVSLPKINEAISNNMVASQSFKLDTWSAATIAEGTNTAMLAAIDDSIDDCKSVAPWPIWLCWFHEPDDNFTTSTQAADYRAAFRFIALRFKAAGVTNVVWQTINKSPYTFLHNTSGQAGDGDQISDGAPSGGNNLDWRWWDPDWKGTNTRTVADWHTGEDAVIGLIGLDQYVPIFPTASYPYTYKQMLDYCLDDMEGCARPMFPITHPEFGAGPNASPRPNWGNYFQAAIDYAKTKNVVAIVYWNHSEMDPHEKDFDSYGDPDGTKLIGWRKMANQAVPFTPPGV